MRVFFSAATQKMTKSVTAQEDKVLRTDTKNARRFCEMTSWGCLIICKIMVPFHNLWIDGDEIEKRSSCATIICHKICA
jgi:hypothetical protein